MSQEEILDDLEDGEIEDDEDDDVVLIEPIKTPTKPIIKTTDSPKQKKNEKPVGDSSSKKRSSGTTTKASSAIKNDDDWASNVQNALAMALKKDGIDVPAPILNTKAIEKEDDRQIGSKNKKIKREKRSRKKIKRDDDKKENKDDDDEDEYDEYEMLGIRGGSPPPVTQLTSSSQPKRDDSYDSSNSSSDSNDYHNDYDRRASYRLNANRRNRSHGQKDGRDRRNDSDDDRYDNKNSTSVRKFELCKFYLMECCAKRDKCLYLHSDFPCKKYYLGMKCVKEKCKFSHGKPLDTVLKNVLLKHLETAPKEILGDFPRLTRENALNMIETRNKQLLIDFNMVEVKPTSQDTAKIPSLLEIRTTKPPSKGEDRHHKPDKQRKSRWCDAPKPNLLPSNSNFLSITNLTGVLSPIQIEKLTQLGIENLNQLNHLSVLQLNELGLSFSQIQGIQLNALNLEKLGLSSSQAANVPQALPAAVFVKPTQLLTSTATESVPFAEIGTGGPDLDMRFNIAMPPAETIGMGTAQDIDMRLLPPATTTIPPIPLAEIMPAPPAEPSAPSIKPQIDTIASPPQESFIDYSQYLRDAKMTLKDIETTNSVDKDEDHQGDTSNVEDELELQIDESRSPSICDDESEKNSDDEKEELPQPPSYFELLPPTIYTDSKLGSLSKIDLSSTVTQLLNPVSEKVPVTESRQEDLKEDEDDDDDEEKKEDEDERNFEEEQQLRTNISKDPRMGLRDPRAEQFRDPRNNDYLQRLHDSRDNQDSRSRSSSPSDNENVSSNVSDGGGTTKKHPVAKQSMYDYDEDDSNESNLSTKSDKDMRLDYLRDHDGDTDLRLPFKPIMTNYVPAKEIDGSLASHRPIIYKVAEVHIPKPDYSSIRRSINPTPDRGLDPRLRRILCIKDDSSDSDNHKILPPVILKLENHVPRVDPRRKKESALPTAPLVSPLVKSSNLDIQLIVQNSNFYKDLSSQQKIMVNQQIAFLVSEVKKYHQDPSPDKIFDVSIVLSNQFLQQILRNVNVLLNMDGQFEEIPIQENWGPGGIPPPRMGTTYPDFMQPPPSVNPMMGGFPPNNMRPGLLGVAPNMPYNIPPGAPPGNPSFYDYNNSYRQQNSGPPMNYDDGNFNPNNNFNQMFDGGNDFNGGGGGNYNHHDGRNNRNNNNFRGRGGGGGGGGPDRWRSGGSRAGNNSGGGQRGGQSRRNNNRFDNKIRDNRKEKSNKN